jgi:hypothetical protein
MQRLCAPIMPVGEGVLFSLKLLDVLGVWSPARTVPVRSSVQVLSSHLPYGTATVRVLAFALRYE